MPFLTKLRLVVARAACCLAASVACGCMTPGQAHKDAAADNTDPTISVQSGTISVPAGVFLDVYYSTPFASAPTLKLTEHWGRCLIVVQTPNHFRVLNSSDKDVTARWQAQGVKALAASAPAIRPAPVIAPVRLAQPVPVPSQTPPGVAGLPAEPEPILSPPPTTPARP
jgi:hypothetical protein